MRIKRPFKNSLKRAYQKNSLSNNCAEPAGLTSDFEENLKFFQDYLADCSDVVFRPLNLQGKKAQIIYTDAMINKQLLTDGVFNSLIHHGEVFLTPGSLEEKIQEIFPIGQIVLETDINQCIQSLLYGSIVILIEGIPQAIVVIIPDWNIRSIEAPEVEPTIRGPKESFTETLNINISLIRRRILHPDFKSKNIVLGEYSKTRISLVYVDTIANPKIVEEVMSRLNRINMDSILDAAYIVELIEDNPGSPFPSLQLTERPDRVTAALLEGRVAILQENSPFAIIAPSVFVNFLQSPEDYYNRYFLGTILRYLRYISFSVSIFLPAFYIAVTAYNQELIPTQLLITLASQREGVPFPVYIEAFAMIFAFELLREAGTRLPKSIGQAVSIVGALIIGDAAVTAGLVSPVMVIVIAFTAIATFTMPTVELNDPIIILRLLFTLLASVLGFWGIFLGLIIVIAHLVSLRSLGIPYMTPLAPVNISDLDDILVRAPQWSLTKRPEFLTKLNTIRKSKKLKPEPGGRGE